MRLVEARLLRYRRFKDEAVMNLDPPVICIVGPNAAGKSTFLDALIHLGHEGDFAGFERTRGTPTSDPLEVRGRFLLEASERTELEAVPEASGATHLVVLKTQGVSGRRLLLDPPPRRDRGPRQRVAQRLKALADHRWTKQVSARQVNQGADEPLETQLRTASDALSRNDETLSPDISPSLRVLASTLRDEEVTHQFRGLPNQLEAVADHEELPHPAEAAEGLRELIPPIVKFDDETRELDAAYDVTESPDDAIANFLQLGGTSWDALRRVVSAGDKGRKQVWLDRINARLRERFSVAWGQGNLELRIDLDGPTLTILMKMQTDDFIEIDQHSDGLRQFIALRALIAVRGYTIKPIVLIDEAETHLHYDAQADLVSVLEAQDDAAKVIYTTHSAGCLPHDLGTGIRAVVPTYREDDRRRVETDHSEVVGRFWAHGQGFSPLLLAMGASAFAFSATQKAAITEGISDAILLPSLIREATGTDRLSYQVVPGYAEASEEDVQQFDLIAARVAFVADGDRGGDANAAKLIAAGMSEDQVVFLGGQGNGLSPEDLLVKDVYIAAVNAELARRHEGLAIPEAEVGDTGRAVAVEDWVKRQPPIRGKPLNIRKAAVAHRVLDQRPRNLVAPTSRKVLRALDRDLQRVFGRHRRA